MPRLVVSSQFFLDEHQWDVLRRDVLPRLNEAPAVRVWSAGCGAGKEPFSIAILQDEAGKLADTRLLATDRDPRLLARAAAGGPFSDADVELLTRDQRAQYLRPGGPPYYVVPRLVRSVTFLRHDLQDPPPEHDFHLVVCRDVQPFFTVQQNRALARRLFDALRPDGWLFLGSTDRIPEWREVGFERYRSTLYRKP